MSKNSGPFSHKARKRFGQNFLSDARIIERIINAINPKENQHLVEIGPGQGAITKPLLESCQKLQVIELDRDLIPILLAQFAKYSEFKIHQQDALKFDFSLLSNNTEPLRIVGNLPYNISTPLIFHLLTFSRKIDDMHFMLQKEVVNRLVAGPGDKNYGRLSVMVQYYCETEHLFDVPPESFNPQPKVNSAIVRLKPYQELPLIAHDKDHFSRLVNLVFQQRRKTLRNTLKQVTDSDTINTLEIDTGLRPEQLSINDYVNLSNTLTTLSHHE